MKKIFLTSLMTFGVLISLLASNPEITKQLAKVNTAVHLTSQQLPQVEAIMNAFSARKASLTASIKDTEKLKTAIRIEQKTYLDKLMMILTEPQKKLYLANRPK